jgi:hypothetical protein
MASHRPLPELLNSIDADDEFGLFHGAAEPRSVTLDSLKVSMFPPAATSNTFTFAHASFFRLAKRS